jgi:hypothetical protein
MNGDGTMTLAFELAALKRLARPDEVFTDARQWTKYVGVISEEPTYVVTSFTRTHRIRQDFFSGPQGRAESLQNVKGQFDTDRHAFIGVDEDDSDLADDTGWEFLHVEDAAEAAEWELGDPEESPAAPDDDEREDWP